MTHTPKDPHYPREDVTQSTWPAGQDNPYDPARGAVDPDAGQLQETSVVQSDLAQGGVPVQPYATAESPSTTDIAKDQAADVKDTAVDAGQQVATIAKEQAQQVGAEVKQQSRQLWQQTVSELGTQASSQQNHLAELIGGYSKELRSMASNSEESGLVTNLAGDAADRAETISTWLAHREPRDVLEEVKRFAQRRPVAFLAIAAASGFVLGRLTRGMVEEGRADFDGQTPAPTTEASSTYLTTTYPSADYPVTSHPAEASYSPQPYSDRPTGTSGVDLGTGPAEFGSGEGNLAGPGVVGGQSYATEGDQRR